MNSRSRLVSTIIPVFNREWMLEPAVMSVLQQTHREVEVVIVDDGSTDQTPAMAARLVAANPERVRFIRQVNQGPGVARNTGLLASSGLYIQYLDSDDLLHPQKFELQIAALDSNPNADLAYGITIRKNLRTGNSVVWARTNDQIANIFPSFLMQRGWDTNAPLWRRSACDRIGPWADFRVLEDWEHDLRAGLLGMQAVHVPVPLVTVQDHDGDRASGMKTGYTPQIVLNVFRAHESIWKRMRTAGLIDHSYLSEFSSKMFWIARMCGERGLIEQAETALCYAEEMATLCGTEKRIWMFRTLKRTVGWKAAVAAVELSARIRRAVHRSDVSA